jgi:hypothetical protein
MARYQYLTVHMQRIGSLNEGQPFVRVEKGAARSSLREVLDEYAEKGWRFVQFVPRGNAGTDQIVFERETA